MPINSYFKQCFFAAQVYGVTCVLRLKDMLTCVSICFDTQWYLDGLFLMDACCSAECLFLCLCKISEKLTVFSFIFVLCVT